MNSTGFQNGGKRDKSEIYCRKIIFFKRPNRITLTPENRETVYTFKKNTVNHPP